MEAWNEERAEFDYVHGSETYAALAARFGMEPAAVRRLGQEKLWHRKRMDYRKAEQDGSEPLEILRLATLRLCRCAGQVAEELDSREIPSGKGDLKALHDAATLIKDLTGLIQNLYTGKEEKMEEVIFRLEGELDGFSH